MSAEGAGGGPEFEPSSHPLSKEAIERTIAQMENDFKADSKTALRSRGAYTPLNVERPLHGEHAKNSPVRDRRSSL